MKKIVYVPIAKTGDAEIRGLENLSDAVKRRITPLFELARSRKSKRFPEGDIYRRLSRLAGAFGNRRFILDLTGEPNLSNEQIEKLHNNRRGYKNWIKFLDEIKEALPKVIPTIQISDEGVDSAEEFYRRISGQVKAMDENFDNIVYRFPLEYREYKNDLDVICKEISGEKIICVIDAGYIPPDKAGIYSETAKQIINRLGDYKLGYTVLAATSFPKNPIEHGGEKEGEYRLEERYLYRGVNRAGDSKLIYGDYATINPTRSLQAGGRGWVPRIDMPTEEVIFYHRSRKSQPETSYADAYIRVAKLMTRDKRYKAPKKKIEDCWGIEQIESAAQEYPQGLSPSFWISVRMNIHMTLMNKVL